MSFEHLLTQVASFNAAISTLYLALVLDRHLKQQPVGLSQESRHESGLGQAAWEPLLTVTVTPATQVQHGVPATPGMTLCQFRLYELEEEERTDLKIDELARRLQIARHERAKTCEAERREKAEGRMFDELMHGPAKHADLCKRATFEMLTCGVGKSLAKVQVWASSLHDYFVAIGMQESEKIEFAAHHTCDLARAWWKQRKQEALLGRLPPILTWDAMKRALLNHFLSPDHEELCYSAWYAVKRDGSARLQQAVLGGALEAAKSHGEPQLGSLL